MQRWRDAAAGGPGSESGVESGTEPMMREIESVSERICVRSDTRVHGAEQISRGRAVEADQGVGTLIALTYMLTLEDPHRFRKSRDAACYVGLQLALNLISFEPHTISGSAWRD